MNKLNIFTALFSMLFLTAILINCHDNIVNPPPTLKNDIIRAKGRNLYKGDTLIYLKGTSVGNRCWQVDNLMDEEFSEKDYQKINDMGMNTIRFLMTYKFFENPGQTADQYWIKDWAWLDSNLSLAKKYGVYLILNIHIPQGYDDSRENAKMEPLWENPENCEKFKIMWKQIALKYKDEPMIAGYDILNEPVVPGTREQWIELAQQTVDSIRTVDTNHVIIIERLENELSGSMHYDDPGYVFFPVQDRYNNLMYSFHFYYPYKFSHQSISGNPGNEVYPDTNALFPGDLVMVTGIYNTPAAKKGSNGWVFLNGDAARFKVDDISIIAAKPILTAHYIKEGKVYFDDFLIKEYDTSGNFSRVIFSEDLESNKNWHMWSQHNDGEGGISTTEAHSGTTSYFLTGISGYGSGYNDDFHFVVKRGYYYSISGWIKGEGIPDGSQCRFSIDFEKSESGEPIHMVNKQYLEQQFAKFNQVGTRYNAPIYVGEFGLNYPVCKSKGGAQWFRDVLDILDDNQVHWTHHIYNGWWFGLYTDENSPGTYIEHTDLITIFKEHLKN